MTPVALLSVSNKTGLIPLAEALCKSHGFQLLSSGGTATAIEDAGLPVTRVSDYTNAPEILGGRVKTLHPRIHGGILAKRGVRDHETDLQSQEIPLIDLVVVNLYPFQETIEKPNVTWENAIENIDIGGPTLVRAAAKNHAHVAVLTSPNQYEWFINALENGVTLEMRRSLALAAFEHTASYDVSISKWLGTNESLTNSFWLKSLSLKQNLRYGENPHQEATWYSDQDIGWGGAKQIQGKELSTNNLLDLESALATVREFGYGDEGQNISNQPAAVVVKHTNPCGVATGQNIGSALKKALDADRTSAFGGIIAVNRNVDKDAANELNDLFLECVVAPEYDQDALNILSKKKNLRLLKLAPISIDMAEKQNIRSILGGVLIQDQDSLFINPNSWKVCTEIKPQPKELEDLKFAWKLVKHVRSNAIVVASNSQSLGIGAGQMNRIGSAKLALEAAGEQSKGAVLASDGFFPFDDTVRLAAEHGIKSIIQPGGSIRDELSLNACNELGLSMVLTGKRHFLH